MHEVRLDPDPGIVREGAPILSAVVIPAQAVSLLAMKQLKEKRDSSVDLRSPFWPLA
jgi:hypothetical protein